MPKTKEKQSFEPIRLFKVQRKLNISRSRAEEFLRESYESALHGSGPNAKIIDQDAYYDLLEEYAEDQRIRARVSELREKEEEEEQEEEQEAPAAAEDDEAAPAAAEETAEPDEAQSAEAEEEEEEAAPPAPEGEEQAAASAAEEETEAGSDEPQLEKADEADAGSEAPPQDPDEAVKEQLEGALGDEEQAAEAEDEAATPPEAEATPEGEEAAAGDDEEDDDETLRAGRYRLSGPKQVGQVDMKKIKKKARERRKKRKRRRKQKKKKKKRKKKDKSRKSPKPDEQDIEEQLQQTLQELEQGASRIRQRRRRERRERHEKERQLERERKRREANILRVSEFVSTGELANLMGEDVNDLISTLMDAGRMASINQRLDAETIEYLVEEFGMEVEFIDEFESETLTEDEEDRPEDLEPRAPVITVMGHVDHGKTSLLDYIRESNVVAGEAGGITQHIGAHRVQLEGSRDITFLDTPGHEAFTAMRARGAKSTDLVILVVAADDAVMPQTIEAINHAQAADVPIVVAINKMDLPEADPQKVMQELSEHDVLVEDYGGDVQCAQVSAETGEGIDDLLEKVTLQADIMELQANPDCRANGTIVESHLEKGRGNVATVLVQRGTLRVGDPFVGGIHAGRVRAMFDERDNPIEEVGPSQPALVLGFDGSPEAGDQFVAVGEDTDAREVAQERQRIHREQRIRRERHIRLDQIGRRLAAGDFQELNLILKADVGGSVEALSDSLMELKTEEVAVNIIHTGVGAITENDVMLAAASEAVILGFQVRPRPGARRLAEEEEIDIRSYSVIYEAVEDVHMALEGLLEPEEREETLGLAEVRQVFDISGVGTIAGCRVAEGRIHRNDQVRLVRDGVLVYEGKIASLKREKDDATEIQEGFECGIGIENFDDVKEGDEIEAFEVIKERRTLEV
jgi:translation initiation factor IF-2